MALGRARRHARCMSGPSRKLWRYGVPTALFLTGVALVIAERAVGIAWAVMVVSLARAAYWMSPTAGGPSPTRGRNTPRGPRAM
jgi:hypothetical protein